MMTEAEREQEHLDRVEAAEALGRCWASGMSIPVCKASICDCWDYPEIPADEDQARAHFARMVDPDIERAKP